MELSTYIVAAFLIGGCFFICALLVLVWAWRRGQFFNLNEGAVIIFDDDEPVGMTMDKFPSKGRPSPSAP
jgi:cbb3-type cytochrome oxidase subunit 3